MIKDIFREDKNLDICEQGYTSTDCEEDNDSEEEIRKSSLQEDEDEYEYYDEESENIDDLI